MRSIEVPDRKAVKGERERMDIWVRRKERQKEMQREPE